MKYMKNLKLHELVIVSVICILLCIEFSIIGKTVLGIEADFLSGGATLFAAFIAYLVFADWKVEHKFRLLEQYHSTLKDRSRIMLEQYMIANNAFSTIEGTRVENGFQKLNEGAVALKIFLENINKINYLITEYKLCVNSLKENEVVIENNEKLNLQIIRIRQIHKDYLSKLPFYRGDINDADRFLEVMKPWREFVIEFNFYCEIELSNFYFDLLNEHN